MYRAALGIPDDRRIVVLNSTWSDSSLFGHWPTLIRSIVAELPIDEYAVVAILHPNIWDGHSPWQIRSWLADCVRSGLRLIPPTEGWRAALVAADAVIGDHGSVTAYGAAIDRPTLLASFPTDEVVPDTVVDAVGRIAPRLAPDRCLRSQIDEVIATHRPGRYAEVAGLVSSVPGSSLRVLRATCYRLMGLAEPEREITARVLPTIGLSDSVVMACRVHCVLNDGPDAEAARVSVTRHAEEVQPPGAPDLSGHLVVRAHHPDPRVLAAADVVLIEPTAQDFPADRWLTETLAARPGIRLAGVLGPGGDCLLLDRLAGRLIVRGPLTHDPALSASALYAWLVAGHEPPRVLTVRAGGTDRRLTVTRDHD